MTIKSSLLSNSQELGKRIKNGYLCPYDWEKICNQFLLSTWGLIGTTPMMIVGKGPASREGFSGLDSERTPRAADSQTLCRCHPQSRLGS